MRSQFVYAIAMLSIGLVCGETFAGQHILNQQVRRIVTGWYAEGLYFEIVNDNHANGCGPGLLIKPDHPMLKEMEAILLSAFHTSTTVDFYAEGCINSGVMNVVSVGITK